jgi:hypothetical protein
MLTINLETFIPLPYIFNIKNSTQLMEDLLDFPFDKDLKFVSFDIENTYSNVPVADLTKIIDVMCEQNGLYTKTRNEIIQMYNILTKQNYFYYKHLNTYKKTE